MYLKYLATLANMAASLILNYVKKEIKKI